MKKIIFLFIFLTTVIQVVSANEVVCKIDEIKIKGSYVNSYKRLDGAPVSGYYKKQYCRKSSLKLESLSFKDTSPKLWKLKEKFKSWNDKEISIVLDSLEKLPSYFKNKKIKSFHRGIKSRFENNPATTLPISNEIVLYDSFFKSKEKERILAHEISHILYLNLTSEEKINFAKVLGWNISPLIRPKKVIYPDSLDGPAEDIANNIEAYFYDRERQLKLNKNISEFIQELVGEKK